MSSTIETTGRPGLRGVFDKTCNIFSKEWLYIGESLFQRKPLIQGCFYKFLLLFFSRNRYLSSVHQSHIGNCRSVILSSKERS